MQNLDKNLNEDQSVVVAFGSTGCGKSTILNYLLEKTLIIKYLNLQARLCCDDPESFQIGHSVKSTTQNIQIKQNGLLKLADFPGLYDTRGIEIQVLNLLIGQID
ncbi:50S ribosome-binding GTPase (macronuclear) [Tetrahymena thermophila SB210]|uniref:50S ribosome-binding GTPase n=1 Tax=Tetrahymena thermophila (strain SB210) TaxID=312017 RepID=Q23CY4_TETTS|nr:50S ribosome-binding GTPase [Tetrahymena thermophila SB210]EAR94392.3 50S ribosome-binding GTPase [Tetrahymena thermophila SB210]|eukprot:XP_001014902.3 50S ribosome-binding GTPase [Tetrahymena thermophila SB210]